MTPEEVLIIAHKATAVPSLILGIIFIFLVLLIVGIITFDSSKGRSKFFIVWLISLFISGLGIVFLSIAPNFVQSISEIASKLWS